ncbi:MAG: GNAT family N-acetyltransferase [Undibacterium sp.]|nr:GNAT family N-acetyltransferase [Undibacterium sp.]
MNIRWYRSSDQDSVVGLILPIQQEEFGVKISLEDQPDLLEVEEFYQQGIGQFWVAMEAEEVIGCIALKEIGQGQAALRKMFVKAAYRGKERQVAQRLLENLLAWAREKEVTEIFLGTTAQYLAAHRFYEKNGFQEIAKTSLPNQFPLVLVDTKFYRLKVVS